MKVEGIYSPKELTTILDVGDSTLRKWCIAIEEQEYFFSRTDNNKRVFVDRDLVLLKHFRQLVQVQNMSLNNAAMIVASKYKEIPRTPGAQDNSENDQRSLEDFQTKVLNEVEQLKELNKQLLTRLDEQQKYIEERLNQRDTMLMDSLRQSQEAKQLSLEVKEAQEKKPRRGLLKWFSKE